MKTEGNFTSQMQQQRGDLCVCGCVSVCVWVCSWGVAAQQRRIRAIAQASTSICYAVKMHKNPETETGIYLNLCRYNVILHYPKNDGVGGFPTQLSATLLLRLCVPVRMYVCVCTTFFAEAFLCALFFCHRLEHFCGAAQSPRAKRFLFYLN